MNQEGIGSPKSSTGFLFLSGKVEGGTGRSLVCVDAKYDGVEFATVRFSSSPHSSSRPSSSASSSASSMSVPILNRWMLLLFSFESVCIYFS
jgi:hypothetical protein